jgi:hypothetical protein
MCLQTSVWSDLKKDKYVGATKERCVENGLNMCSNSHRQEGGKGKMAEGILRRSAKVLDKGGLMDREECQ